MTKIKVYYEDTDASCRVYHANYLKYLERGRSDYVYKLGINHFNLKNKYNTIFVVKKCNINFKKPAFFEDDLLVKTEIVDFSEVKIIFLQKILRKKELLVLAEVTVVSINNSGKINKMPNIISKKLKNNYIKV